MRKEDGHGRRGGETSANVRLEARRVNAQMSKHRVDPPAPMFFDGTETSTGQTEPNFRSKYPPAKPGALGWEPLKAAQKAAYAAYTRLNLNHAASRQVSILSPDARASLSLPFLERWNATTLSVSFGETTWLIFYSWRRFAPCKLLILFVWMGVFVKV